MSTRKPKEEYNLVVRGPKTPFKDHSDLSDAEIMEMANDVETYSRFLPDRRLGRLSPNYWCRAWNSKREKYCAMRAGAGTDHLGEGRCSTHGGRQQLMDNIFAGVSGDSIQEKMLILKEQTEAERMDISKEVDMIRALVATYLEEFDEIYEALKAWNVAEEIEAFEDERRARPQPLPRLESVVGLLKQSAQMADKIHEQMHRDSIPKRTFIQVQQRLATIAANKIEAVIHIIGDDLAKKLLEELKEEWDQALV